MKLKIFSLSLCLIFTANGERESLVSEEVYLRIDECIVDYRKLHLTSDTPAAKALREKAFEGLNDREKIRALAEWMFRKTPPTSIWIPSHAGILLTAPEPIIDD